jgi:hypothetical protein
MKVAVLESETKRINGHLKSFESVTYQNLSSLLKDFKGFDAIVIDKKFINLDIAKLFKDFDIETVILNSGKIDFDDSYITEIIDYSEIDSIKEKMQYVQSKCRIKKALKHEEIVLDSLLDIFNRLSVA